ncbi:MAG TPA: LysR family transcriptional regulator [Caulobacteraceae bacterium]|nr:LysR family transcriptional regulator [Caulobacteraceae bacterium]
MDPALSSLKLDLLRQFHAIATHGSLKKAARALHLTPPSVTHALAKLEEALGCTLCFRGRSGFRLTEAGRRLLATTESVFGQLSETFAALGNTDDFTGVFNLGLLDGLPSEPVDSALFEVTRRYPSCRLNLRVTDPDEINKLVYEGELHAGIAIFHKRLEALNYERVGSETLAYYISDQHPLWDKKRIGREDLSGLDVAWIDAEKMDGFSLETEVFGDHPTYRMKVAAYSNSVVGGLRILLSGKTVVPLPISYMERFVGAWGLRIRRVGVETNAPTLAIDCVSNPRLPAPPPLRLLLASLDATEPSS